MRNEAEGAILPGFFERDVRQGAGNSAKGNHAFLSAQPLWLREGVFVLDHGQLPGIVRLARQQRDIFNHESPRRGETFVTRKITRALAQIAAGLQDKLYLGNLDAKRDWGYAREYVEAMWLMLQQDKPDDYVVATGETHSIREFLDLAFAHAGLSWEKYVEIDPRYYRPAEVDLLIGDASKARRQLGWEPKTKFADLVKLMVDADIKLLKDHREGRIKVTN